MAKSKKYYWLKLKTSFFNDKVIKKLRKFAGGDTYVIIYLKLQLISLKNEGIIFYDGIEDDFASEMALALDEDEENVRVTIGFLERYGLIEQISKNEFMLTEVPEIIGSECESAERVRKHCKALQCNDTVTRCNTELQLDKNIVDNIEDTDIKLEDTDVTNNEFLKIANIFNSVCLSLTPVKSVTEERLKKVCLIRRKYGDDFDFEAFFQRVENSDFLTGRNGRWYTAGEKQANFDWIMKFENLSKILRGSYDNKESRKNASNSIGSFGSISDEDLDFIVKLGTNI